VRKWPIFAAVILAINAQEAAQDEEAMCGFNRIIAFIILTGVSVGYAFSLSFAQVSKSDFEQCRASKDPAIKLHFCSEVLKKSKDKSQIERAYNSRGLANIKRSSSAVIPRSMMPTWADLDRLTVKPLIHQTWVAIDPAYRDTVRS
jgi:hypothetical protein